MLATRATGRCDRYAAACAPERAAALPRMRSAPRSAIMIVGRVGVAARDDRHDRRVDHPQTLQAVHAQLRVDDGIIVCVAHTRRADRVVDQHQASAQVRFEIRALCHRGSWLELLQHDLAQRRPARRSPAPRCMPATSDSTSSGSESVFVMIRGLALGIGRAQAIPDRALGGRRARGLSPRSGRRRSRRRGLRSRQRPCGTGCPRPAGRARAHERDDLGDASSVSGPDLRSSHSASGLGLSAPYSVLVIGDLPDHRHERVILEVAANAAKLVANGDARHPELVRGADSRQQQQLGGVDRARSRAAPRAGAHELLTAAPSAHAHADRAGRPRARRRARSLGCAPRGWGGSERRT